MPYVVNQKCVLCKHTSCVEVCPVDCFYEGENMLVINPDECIDCGVCEPECPIDAIEPMDSGELVDFNRQYAEQWPQITKKKEPLSDHEKYKDEDDKITKYFKGK